MPRTTKSDNGRPIESYEHADKERVNNPPVGLVTPDTDPDAGAKTYAYDPHLDPQLAVGGQGRAYLLRGAHRLAARPRAHRPAHHHRGGAHARPTRTRAVQLSLFETAREEPAAARGHRVLQARPRLVATA